MNSVLFVLFYLVRVKFISPRLHKIFLSLEKAHQIHMQNLRLPSSLLALSIPACQQNLLFLFLLTRPLDLILAHNQSIKRAQSSI